MFRKTISIILGVMLLLCMSMPVFATTNDAEPAAAKTVEEILNEYHEKAYQTRMAEGADDSAKYSRQVGGTSKTLEEETVEELIAAGYEAYSITPENYDVLENRLNTDFGSMGLNKSGSYIVVINGGDSDEISNVDYGATDIPFEYTYNGTVYLMRYITVTSAHDYRYFQTDTAPLISATADAQKIENALNSLLGLGLGATESMSYLGNMTTIANICGISFFNINLSYQVSLNLQTDVYWTRVFTQIYKEGYDIWTSYSSVDYVKIINRFTGSYYDAAVNRVKSVDETLTEYRYSDHFYDYDWRKRMAARGWYYGRPNHEYVGNVVIYRSLEGEYTEIFRFTQHIGTVP